MLSAPLRLLSGYCFFNSGLGEVCKAKSMTLSGSLRRREKKR